MAQAAVFAGRFAVRPAILPLAKRWGLKPMLIVGCLIVAAQYPVMGQVHGVGPALVAWCLIAAVGDVFYWPSYHAYFAAVGDAQHRGHQLGAREAMVAVAAATRRARDSRSRWPAGPGPRRT